jgi:hypothetical protein
VIQRSWRLARRAATQESPASAARTRGRSAVSNRHTSMAMPQADEALYRAKAEGRDRTVVAAAA